MDIFFLCILIILFCRAPRGKKSDKFGLDFIRLHFRRLATRQRV